MIDKSYLCKLLKRNIKMYDFDNIDDLLNHFKEKLNIDDKQIIYFLNKEHISRKKVGSYKYLITNLFSQYILQNYKENRSIISKESKRFVEKYKNIHSFTILDYKNGKKFEYSKNSLKYEKLLFIDFDIDKQILQNEIIPIDVVKKYIYDYYVDVLISNRENSNSVNIKEKLFYNIIFSNNFDPIIKKDYSRLLWYIDVIINYINNFDFDKDSTLQIEIINKLIDNKIFIYKNSFLILNSDIIKKSIDKYSDKDKFELIKLINKSKDLLKEIYTINREIG